MLNILREPDKKFILRNCFLLSTVCAGLLFSASARAELIVSNKSGGLVVSGNNYTPTNYLAETRTENTYTELQTFDDITFSKAGSATVNTIAKNISATSTNNELVTAKAVYNIINGIVEEDPIADLPTRDAMKAWQEQSNHGKYELSTTATGEDGEQSVEINSTTYYFMPNETLGMDKVLSQLLASGTGLTTSGASENDYVFKTTDGENTTYYKFNTSSLSDSKIKIVEGSSSDYTYYKTLSDGTIQYYKVNGTTSSASQNTNVTSDIVGKYYQGKSSTTDGRGGALTINNGKEINTIEADFNGNSSTYDGGAIENTGIVTSLVGDFSKNTAKDGGAIWNGYKENDSSGGIISAIIGDFYGNTANSDVTTESIFTTYSHGAGGAIANTSNIISITGDFYDNTASFGGAIANADDKGNHIGTIGTITGNFSNNTARYGGAIYNQTGTITNIIGDFNNNTANTNGSAIYNKNGTIENIKGNFNNNKGSAAISSDGMIYNITGNFNNNDGAIIGSNFGNITGNFNDNTKYAISVTNATNIIGSFNNNEDAIHVSGEVTNIEGTFNNNYSTADNGNNGGVAITVKGNNNNKAKVTNIIADFSDNINTADLGNGAISVWYGSVENIKGNFNNNKTTGGWSYGGAIYVRSGTINNVTGDFINNESENGGAIGTHYSGKISTVRGNFTDNLSGTGGAIDNNGEITNITGNFYNNKAKETVESLGIGGAIYNDGTVGLFADGQDITFYNNTDSTGYNDLYGGTFNLNAQTGYGINFGGSVRKVTALNINNDTSAGNRGGEYVFNNTIDAGVNLYNGAKVKLANIKQADGSTSYGVINTTKKLTVDSVAGTNIDMRNDHIDTNTVGGMTLGSNIGLDIDTNLRRHSASTSDKILSTATATGDGKMVINSINLLNSAYGEGDSIKISIADYKTKDKIVIADDILDNITGATNYYTKVEYDEDTGDLVFTDKLVNKSTLDQALTDAGIGDMSIYAKKDDVYTQTQADDKFATKTSLGSYVTSESLGTTLGSYVTSENLNTTLGGYATTGSVYTKDEADGKFLTEHQDISGKANISDVYTKSQADGTFATKASLNDYIKSSELSEYIDIAASKTITPTRDAMKAWQNLNNHGRYELSTTSTGAANERSIKIGSTTYYFLANEANDEMNQSLAQLLANGTSVTTSGASESDYTFKVTNGETSTYYKFDTSGISASKVQITDGNSTDYTFYKILSDGAVQYYKVTSSASSAARNTNLTTNVTGKYYKTLSSSDSSYGGALTVRNGNSVDKIEADFNGNSATYGGAIKTDGNIKIITGDFSSNTANGAGGAIYNHGDTTAINGNFYNNYAASHGGAIRNHFATIDSITGTFIGNHTASDGFGGAINNNSNATIGSITGYFNNNTSGYGGAIVSDGTITLIDGVFESNRARYYGGAIASGTVTTLNGKFNNNEAPIGGAINTGVVTTLTGEFNHNSATDKGGAIRVGNKVTTLSGTFNQNTAVTTGGAIANDGTISSLSGEFNQNSSQNSGGAISNMGTITKANANFNENTAYKGGGVWNVGTINSLKGNFDGNTVTSLGGAILNGSSEDGTKVGNIVAVTANFTNNYASTDGGAIANGTTLGLLAKDQNIIFYNNTDSTGYNDLFGNDTGTFNLNAQQGYGINFGGSVRQVTTLNINNDSSAANRGGDYIFNNTVDAGVNLYNGANIKLSTIQQEDGTTSYGVINTTKAMTVDGVAGANIDMRNNHIDTNTVGGLTLGSNLGLGIDTNLRRYSTSTSDKLVSTAATTGDGKMVINSINLTSSAYGEGDSMSVNIADDNTKDKIAIADDILDNITGATNYYTKVEYDENTGDLVFTDKLVNKSTLDQALQDAGVADMSIYAKTADVYNNVYTKSQANEKFATIESLGNYVTSESLGTTLGGYVTTGGLNTALTPYAKSSDVAETYATKDSITDMLTKTEANSTYATNDALNNGLNAKANQSDLTALQGTVSGLSTTVSDLSTTVAGKANQSDLETLQTTVAGKANQSDLEALQTTVAGKANQSDLTALQGTVSDLSTTVAGKANQSDLETLQTTVAGKANQSDLETLQTTVAGKANQSDLETLQTTVAGKANQSDLTALQGTVSDLSTTVAGKANQSDLEVLQTTVAGKANQSDLTALQGTVSDLSTTVAGKANQSDLTALQGTVSGLSTSIAGKANQSDLEALQTTVAGKANASDVYTKDEADNKYATQNAISDMLTKTEAGNTYATQSALNDYKTSNDNAVSALTGKMTQAETDISGIKGSAVMSSGITAEKVAAYEGYAALIDAKQDALSTEQMALLNSGITAADIATVQTANTRLDAMDTTVADLSADFGDVADFSNSKTGNLKNDVPSSSKPNASTVTKAIANMDATIGQIHGLAAKVGVENGGANLGQNTTVEEHLTSLAGSIGNRTHYTQQNYIKNNQTVAQSLDNLDIAVGSMRRDFTSAQIANEARFNDIEHNINHLENKMEKGLAANNALAALKPLSSTYQTQLSAAMGGYENNQAFAIGGFHYVTEKVLLNTGVAYGGNNSMSYNVGVTFGF